MVVEAHKETCRARIKKYIVGAGEAVIAGEPSESRSDVCVAGTIGDSCEIGEFQGQWRPRNRETRPRARTRAQHFRRRLTASTNGFVKYTNM